MLRVLVLEPEPSGPSLLRDHVTAFGHTVQQVDSAEAILAWLAHTEVDVVALRCMDPGEAMLQRIRAVRLLARAAEIVIVATPVAEHTAIDAVREGAHGYLVEPYRVEALEVAIQKAGEHGHLRRQNSGLRAALKGDAQRGAPVGSDTSLRHLMEQARRIAPTPAPVLLTGEVGTGKRFLARAVHAYSDRPHEPFVIVHCTGKGAGALEQELFGDATGQAGGPPGLVRAAESGTLCLVGIGAVPATLQARLLGLLEQTTSAPRVRLIATSTADLRNRVADGTFREDFYYHLNSMELRVPPLRERLEDLPELVVHFLAHAPLPARAHHASDAALDVLRRYPWPGNLWELRNVVERAGALASGTELGLSDLPLLGREPSDAPPRADLHGELRLAEAERIHIERVLRHHGGNKTHAARALGITTKTLYNKLSKYN